ncbi:hypothetical protein QJS10_CPB15g01792 [Acorus calamus]|uniref:Uncharacterized protein n=1 Tax=Acorus calamus TaxID=4465 RepID=A0AAV9D9G1_ACOCL|nr:hypothetical protein QJS10_CPB15g01792 [Acorus calamus]
MRMKLLKEQWREAILCNSVNFKNDGTADFFFGPMNPIREFGGERAMFYYIQNYENVDRDGSLLNPQVVGA